MLIEFDEQTMFTQSINITDIGLVALKCTNNSGDTYYIAVQTAFGKTTIIKFGPVLEDIDTLLDEFNLSYKKIDYKETLIIDGEIICDYETFKEFSDSYANPRNFAAGSIRLLNAKESASRRLSFVAWDVIKGIYKNSLSFYYNKDLLRIKVK